MPAPPPAPAKTRAKKSAKKSFNAPKLQGVKSFNNYKGSAPKKDADNDSAEDILKNLPPGAENNPAVRQYIESQRK